MCYRRLIWKVVNGKESNFLNFQFNLLVPEITSDLHSDGDNNVRFL